MQRLYRSLRTQITRSFTQPKRPITQQTDKDHNQTHFGFKNLSSPVEKQGLVNSVFSSVADKYDLMNDLMSFGIHRLWKDYTIQEIGLIAPKRKFSNGSLAAIEKTKVLDVACGTGDMSLKFYQHQLQHANSVRSVKNQLEIGNHFFCIKLIIIFWDYFLMILFYFIS